MASRSRPYSNAGSDGKLVCPVLLIVRSDLTLCGQIKVTNSTLPMNLGRPMMQARPSDRLKE